MSASESKTITLKSSDDEEFVIDEVVAREFQIVAHMIEDDCADKPIPLENVTSAILSKVIEYCKNNIAAASTQEDEEKKKIREGDITSLDTPILFQLILAANYLNFKSLLDLACQTIADNIKDKTPEEIREIFNVVNDYTPEEEAAVRQQNAWAFE